MSRAWRARAPRRRPGRACGTSARSARRPRPAPSSSVPNAAARSACTCGGGDAEPARLAGEVAARVRGVQAAAVRRVLPALAVAVASRTGRARWSRRASSRRWPAAGTWTGSPGWWARPPAWSRSSRAARRPACEPRRGERGGHLEVRVGTGGEPAEHLEDRLLAEDQAGVALLAAEHQAVEPGREARRRGSSRIRSVPIVCVARRCPRAAAWSGRRRAARRRRCLPSPDGPILRVLQPDGQPAPQARPGSGSSRRRCRARPRRSGAAAQDRRRRARCPRRSRDRAAPAPCRRTIAG